MLIERASEPLLNQCPQRFVLFVGQLPRADKQVVREINRRLHILTMDPYSLTVKYGLPYHPPGSKSQASRCRPDLDGLRPFCADYPAAEGHLFYGESKRYRFEAIDVVPIGEGLSTLREVLGGRRPLRRKR